MSGHEASSTMPGVQGSASNSSTEKWMTDDSAVDVCWGGLAGGSYITGGSAVLAKDPNSVPSSHTRQLRSTCNSSSRRCLPLLVYAGIHMCTHTKMTTQKKSKTHRLT